MSTVGISLVFQVFRRIILTTAHIGKYHFVDAGIFFNDIDGDNKVTSSYYEDAPFIGQTFASYEDYQKQTGDFYYQKFVKFMNEHNA